MYIVIYLDLPESNHNQYCFHVFPSYKLYIYIYIHVILYLNLHGLPGGTFMAVFIQKNAPFQAPYVLSLDVEKHVGCMVANTNYLHQKKTYQKWRVNGL